MKWKELLIDDTEAQKHSYYYNRLLKEKAKIQYMQFNAWPLDTLPDMYINIDNYIIIYTYNNVIISLLC